MLVRTTRMSTRRIKRIQICKATQKNGKPCNGKCPEGETFCEVHLDDGRVYLTSRKGAVGPKYRAQTQETCRGFTQRGEPCKASCPAGYTECWRHMGGGVIQKTRTQGATGKNNQVYLLSDDEDNEEGTLVVSGDDEEETLLLSVRGGKIEAKEKENAPLRKGQCLCFDSDGTRCRRYTSYGSLYYCSQHAENGACKKTGGEITQTEMRNRQENDPYFKEGGNAKECCGEMDDGKCMYGTCDNNFRFDYPKAQASLARAKKAGKNNVVRKIEALLAADNCQECGNVIEQTMVEGPKGTFKVCQKKKGQAEVCETRTRGV